MHGEIGRDRGAALQRRDVDELGLLAVGGRPVIGAAGGVGTHPPRHLVVVHIGALGIELEVLAGLVLDRLAGLGIDALGPGDLIDMLGGLEELAVAAIEDVFEAVAARMRDDLAILAVHLGVDEDVGAGLVVVAVVVGRILEIPARACRLRHRARARSRCRDCRPDGAPRRSPEPDCRFPNRSGCWPDHRSR